MPDLLPIDHEEGLAIPGLLPIGHIRVSYILQVFYKAVEPKA